MTSLHEGKIENQNIEYDDYCEKRCSRTMNQVWAYRAKVKKSKDRKTDTEVIKMLCRRILIIDRDRDLHHGR